MASTYGHRKYQAPWDSSLCCCVYSVRDLVVLSYISRGVVRWGNPRGKGEATGGEETGQEKREEKAKHGKKRMN